MTDFRMLIGGNLVAGANTMDVLNPATEQVVAVCPRASRDQADQAVAAAKSAFPGWAALPVGERRSYLVKLADGLQTRTDEFARLLTEEQGKPLAEAVGEVGIVVGFLRYFAALELPVQVIEDNPQRLVELHRKPLGVVLGIIPWNFPLAIISFKLPPALLVGNTMVIKPAPTTPLTALRFGELCAEILPPGVVNIITDANDLGDYLTSHPDIRKVSFTGSTATGKKVMASVADTLKRMTLELGGNDAGIVLEGADPVKAAPGIYAGAFMNAGQVCLALKRLYVHDSIYDEMCDELVKMADGAVVGDGLQQGTQIGPLQNAMQYNKVKGILEEARRDGTIIAGGQVPDGPGYFIRPTIVRDISDGSRLVDEEQFGPILPVIRFSDASDAVARANASPFGLGGSVWSEDIGRACQIAMQLEAGTVWVNKHLDLGPNIPFAGAKSSGIGAEFGMEGLAEFTQIQVLNVAR